MCVIHRDENNIYGFRISDPTTASVLRYEKTHVNINHIN